MGPGLWIEIAIGHECDVVGIKFALLETLEKSRVLNVGGGVQITDDALGGDAIEVRKFGILPDATDVPRFGFFERRIEETAFEVFLGGGGQRSASCGDHGSNGGAIEAGHGVEGS